MFREPKTKDRKQTADKAKESSEFNTTTKGMLKKFTLKKGKTRMQTEKAHDVRWEWGYLCKGQQSM